MSTRAPITPAHADCDSCPLVARREFLGRATLALAALGLNAVLPTVMHALPRRAADGASERRFPIPAADGVTIDRDDALIVARTGPRVYAFALTCPHQNTALRWDAGSTEFRCPKHKSRYRPDGTFIEGRATRAMDRLAIRRDGDAIVVDVDAAFRQDQQPAQWAAAVVVVDR